MCVIYDLQCKSHQSTGLLGGEGLDDNFLCLGVPRQKVVWCGTCTVNMKLRESARVTGRATQVHQPASWE